MRWTEVYDSDADEVQRLQDEVQALRAKIEAVRHFAERLDAHPLLILSDCGRNLHKALGDPESPNHERLG